MGLVCENAVFQRGGFRIAANWELPPGGSLALIGPSGSGKSLFLNGIAGFEQLVEGQLRVADTDIAQLSPGARPLTMLFQDNNLFPHLTANENVALGITAARRLTPEEAARVDEALIAVGLDRLGSRYPKDLSGGQQSRVALARALLRARPLLMLDEPFSALGPGLRRQMLHLVKDIAQIHGATLIFVTHQPEDCEAADLTAFVGEHRVHTPEPTAKLFRNPPKDLQDYL